MELQCFGLSELCLSRLSCYCMLYYSGNVQSSAIFNKYWLICLSSDIATVLPGVDCECQSFELMMEWDVTANVLFSLYTVSYD